MKNLFRVTVASIKQSTEENKSVLVYEVQSTDFDGKIDRVEFYVDHQFRGSEREAPFIIEIQKKNGKQP